MRAARVDVVHHSSRIVLGNGSENRNTRVDSSFHRNSGKSVHFSKSVHFWTDRAGLWTSRCSQRRKVTLSIASLNSRINEGKRLSRELPDRLPLNWGICVDTYRGMGFRSADACFIILTTVAKLHGNGDSGLSNSASRASVGAKPVRGAVTQTIDHRHPRRATAFPVLRLHTCCPKPGQAKGLQ
jgi:hypothetical protein